MYRNSCWGTDSWWIIILFAIILIWIFYGNSCQDNYCGTTAALDCGGCGCCH